MNLIFYIIIMNLSLCALQLAILGFIYRRLRIIEITKEIVIITKPKEEKPVVPMVMKAKTGYGNHILNDIDHDGRTQR